MQSLVGMTEVGLGLLKQNQDLSPHSYQYCHCHQEPRGDTVSLQPHGPVAFSSPHRVQAVLMSILHSSLHTPTSHCSMQSPEQRIRKSKRISLTKAQISELSHPSW